MRITYPYGRTPAAASSRPVRYALSLQITVQIAVPTRLVRVSVVHMECDAALCLRVYALCAVLHALPCDSRQHASGSSEASVRVRQTCHASHVLSR